MRVITALVLSALLAGCSMIGTPAAGPMCDAAGSLSAAKTLVERAAAKDASGDKPEAQVLAAQAAALAERGHVALESVESGDVSGDVKAGETWQALLDAYLHIGQAANALLPRYEITYGSTADELATGSRSLRAALSDLPAGCFTATSAP